MPAWPCVLNFLKRNVDGVQACSVCVCDEVVHYRVRKYTETPDLNVVEARDFDIFIVVYLCNFFIAISHV